MDRYPPWGNLGPAALLLGVGGLPCVGWFRGVALSLAKRCYFTPQALIACFDRGLETVHPFLPGALACFD